MGDGTRSGLPSIYVKDMYKVKFQNDKAATMRHKEIFQYVGSADGAGDKETQLIGAGDLERHTAEGQDINFSSPAEGWPFYVKFHTYSGGLKLTFEANEDPVKMKQLLQKFAATWSKSSVHARETLSACIFNDGGDLSGSFVFNGSHQGQTDPSGDLLYDGVPMFALTGNPYTKKDGTTYYNSVAGLTLDVDSFEQIYNLHVATNAFDEQGRPIVDAVDTLISRRGADYTMARRIYETEKGLPGGELNDFNPWQNVAKPMDWAYLEDAEAAFFVGKRGSELLQFIQRMPGSFDYFIDHDNRGSKVSYVERFGIWVKGRPFSRGGGTSA
jgi:hypothetical protein